MDLDRSLSFKGGRTYLHSTTVFDDILRLKGGALRSLDFRFDHKTDRQVRYQSEPPGNGAVVATWHDQDGMIHVVERAAAITDSTPYDEEGLAARFAYGERHVSLPADLGGNTLIEAIVAGYKALLQRTVAGGDARLAFVRLRLSYLPALPLDIYFTRRIGEFFQGEIRSAGEPVGQIFFGQWR